MKQRLGLWALGVLILSLFLGACSTPRSIAHYSPPSAAPVRDPITRAQDHAAAAKRDLSQLSTKDPQQALALASAAKHIDALTYELTVAQTALNTLEHQAADQTSALNKASDEKNAALMALDRERAKIARVEKREHLFFLILFAALAWIFRVPLLALLKLLGSLVLKIPAI